MPQFMLIAGEASGDLLAAELVSALRVELSPTPTFFGAGGPKMAEAGVDLAFDMTRHAVVGLIEVLKNYRQFKRLFDQLLELAVQRKPDVIVCVDFSGFNRRFAAAVRREQRRRPELNWKPKIVQYVSPQVWASRPKRAEKMARDFNLVLAIFPFEKEWYEQRVPSLRVEFVGHPIIDRFLSPPATGKGSESDSEAKRLPTLLLLPGSRAAELDRHLPVMLEAAEFILRKHFASLSMVLPSEALAARARELIASIPRLHLDIKIQVGGLAEALREATAAIASTGTVTMECAYWGVPTVAIYKTSWSTYQIGRRIIQVPFLAMPNILAGEAIFPEFIQHSATPENIAQAALALLNNPQSCGVVKAKLASVVASLGEPGASGRAAWAILQMME